MRNLLVGFFALVFASATASAAEWHHMAEQGEHYFLDDSNYPSCEVVVNAEMVDGGVIASFTFEVVPLQGEITKVPLQHAGQWIVLEHSATVEPGAELTVCETKFRDLANNAALNELVPATALTTANDFGEVMLNALDAALKFKS